MKIIDRQIFRLAIPNIISNITIPLVGLVDTFLVGHLDNSNYIGAVALGSVVFMFLYSGFGFLRASTTGFTAQSYGARSFQGAMLAMGQGLLVAAVGATLLLIFQNPLKSLAFGLMNGSAEMESLAAQYFSIRIWAAPAALGNYVLSGWFIGMQNARSPMVVAIIVNVLNILISSLCILVWDMKSDGVALGTVIAQYGGFLTSLYFFFRYYRKLLKYWSLKAILNVSRLATFFRVNTDILIRSLLLTGTFFYFTTYSAHLGDDILNLNSLMLQFLWLLSYFVDGFAYAAESLVGKAVGARDSGRLRQYVIRIFQFAAVITLIISLLYFFFYDDFFDVLSDKQELRILLNDYAHWIWLMPLVATAAFIWDGIYIGAIASKALRNSMIISSLLVFLPLLHFLVPVLHNQGMWLALLAFLLTRGLMLTIYYPKVLRKVK